MQIHLHIGLEQVGTDRLQSVLAEKRDQLVSKGVLYPRSPGHLTHTRLCMAVTDNAQIDTLRFDQRCITDTEQIALRDKLAENLRQEIARHRPEHLILSNAQLGTHLASRSELDRLRDFLLQFSPDIRVVTHIDEPARLLARYYGSQILQGRSCSLDLELELAGTRTWWRDALTGLPAIDPQAGIFREIQAPPFWLDYIALEQHWTAVFGPGAMIFRAYDARVFSNETVTHEIRAAFDIQQDIGHTYAAPVPPDPSAAWLARARQLNELILYLLKTGKRDISRPLWRSFLNELEVGGDPIDPASLWKISETFSLQNQNLSRRHGLNPDLFQYSKAEKLWSEADPTRGFRASQYLLSFMWRIEKEAREANGSAKAGLERFSPKTLGNSRTGTIQKKVKQTIPQVTQYTIQKVQTSAFAPHNGLNTVDEDELAPDYSPRVKHDLPENSSGNVIVGCMKNEAPYLVEWVAYHREIGVDSFLIYSNGCDDGTDEMLERLQQMGVLQHRKNNNWSGNSPQQHALNRSLAEPVVQKAEWIIHIDADEFINVRTGNGTLDDFFVAVPDATNVAMTWRLFGHNGVTALKDAFVIDQFDRCAPAYCPKPHTVWGFKTMFRNIGAYKRISCHRPNQMDPAFRDKVLWVNGSGKNVTGEVAERGWRSSKKSIGYDLLQLNHYAVRSAESFLIKRHRGRALHIDRSIGLGYWIRMDWSDFRDMTIKRNLPRLRAEYDRLMQDKRLQELHRQGVTWHKKKAAELRQDPEYRHLYDQVTNLKLNYAERVAYAGAMGTEA